MDRKNKEEQMVMLGLKETLDRMAKANGVRWYGRVIRRDDDNILKKAMMLEVNGQQCSLQAVRVCARTRLSETAHTRKFTAHRHVMKQCSRPAS